MRRCSLSLAGLLALTAAGCMPKMTAEEMKKEMQVERPAELDALNAFAGSWHGTGTCKMEMLKDGGEIATSGNSKAEWEADGWYLVERSTYEMGDFGTMQGIGIWTYDPKAKKYRNWWFDTTGSFGEGTATRDASTNTWTMKAESESPHGKSYGTGSVKIVDDNTMEWTWNEYADMLHTMPVMEMTGTSKRTSN